MKDEMSRLSRGVRRLTRSPGVPQARHIAERSVAPYLRSDVHALGISHGLTVDRISDLELKVEQLYRELSASVEAVRSIETHQPAILNAVASTNGTTRLLARETAALTTLVEQTETQLQKVETTQRKLETNGQTATQLQEVKTSQRKLETELYVGDESVRQEMRPHIGTIAYLLQRVETIRAEMMHEFRYGAAKSGEGEEIETKIVNAEKLHTAELRINFGAGHIALDGFVNVDMRELPGIDVVAPVQALPFEPGSLTEIFSSHTIEHFPELELRRKLLPYWVGLLKAGGTFRAVVPDLEAMSREYAAGKISFEEFRAVVYGGQEYEGDFHFTGFTPDSLGALLTEAGLDKPTVIAKGRPNGDCLEFEISASKPIS
jgi:hypothetical protein